MPREFHREIERLNSRREGADHRECGSFDVAPSVAGVRRRTPHGGTNGGLGRAYSVPR